ncbi:MAG: hypothetical protein ACK5IA_12675, partial [Cyanobacteriota bacterium]
MSCLIAAPCSGSGKTLLSLCLAALARRRPLRCLIAAPCSGSGKTLLTLRLTALARRRGSGIQPFKVGPD